MFFVLVSIEYDNFPNCTFIKTLQSYAVTNNNNYLIDVSVPNRPKINKYTELKEEITGIWNLNKICIAPVVISATGVIPKV